MTKLKHRLAVLAVSLIGLAAIATPAAQAADAVIPLNNWQVGGSLGIKKLNQSIQLPPGSAFNGSVNLTQGTIEGHTTIPDFTPTVRVLGIPTQIGVSLTEAGPTTGTLVINPDGSVTSEITVPGDLRITKLRIGLLRLPTGANCHTRDPLVLQLHYQGPLDLVNGFAFSGTYTLPRLTGCGLLTPTLNLLMAGPNNPYSITLKPPTG